jgi:hypothetical protein
LKLRVCRRRATLVADKRFDSDVRSALTTVHIARKPVCAGCLRLGSPTRQPDQGYLKCSCAEPSRSQRICGSAGGVVRVDADEVQIRV